MHHIEVGSTYINLNCNILYSPDLLKHAGFLDATKAMYMELYHHLERNHQKMH